MRYDIVRQYKAEQIAMTYSPLVAPTTTAVLGDIILLYYIELLYSWCTACSDSINTSFFRF